MPAGAWTGRALVDGADALAAEPTGMYRGLSASAIMLSLSTACLGAVWVVLACTVRFVTLSDAATNAGAGACAGALAMEAVPMCPRETVAAADADPPLRVAEDGMAGVRSLREDA